MPVTQELPGLEYFAGRPVSHAELKVTGHVPGADSLDFTGVKEVVRQTTVAVGLGGGGSRPTYRTSGRNSYTASMIFSSLADKDKLVEQLVAIAEQNGYVRDGDRVRWGMVEFTLEFRLFYPGVDDGHVRVLERARFINESLTITEGEAIAEEAMGISIMDTYDMTRGGKKAVIN